MDLKEALNIIGLPKTASAEELKTKYKELAKKFHPDVYKEDPGKFKKINEAYQLIQDYKSNPDKYDKIPFRRAPFSDVGGMGGISFDDLFGFGAGQHQQQQKTFSYPPLNTYLKISFKESVLGADKDVSFKKYMKCGNCNGRGSESIKNDCESCDGFGRIVSNNKGMIFTRVCTKCYGKDIKVKSCAACSSLGVSEVETNITIHVPPGTPNNATLRLRGAGHYIGGNVFGDAHTDVYVFINVLQEDGLTLEGSDVICHLKLSLLEALVGCEKEVKTIYDTRKVKVNAKSKNKDEIRINGCGVVSSGGVQRVIFDVEYPINIEDLIKYLKKKEN
jgi:molecular chaperone DnaJ